MIDRLVGELAGWRRFDLSHPYVIGMPQSPNHPQYWHTLARRHGDMMRADGGSAANDYITMGTHVGTHVDALSHVSHNGLLHRGEDAAQAQVGGRFERLGIHTMQPFVGRGVLLDVPAALGMNALSPGQEVSPEDLEAAASQVPSGIHSGDAILIRTGWGSRWDEGDAFVGRDSGVPGPGERAGPWLSERSPVIVGADSIAFEHLSPGAGHAVLPLHRILLVERGIHIVETLALEDLAASGVLEFLLVLIPMPLVGATGSPVRPIALAPQAPGD